MSISLTANLYSGPYGPKDRTAELLVMKVMSSGEASPIPSSINLSSTIRSPGIKRNVILVIDTSGSMEPVMGFVKSLLRSLGDMIGASAQAGEPKVLGNELETTIITFSNSANVVWTSGSGSYSDAIETIRADGGTNLSDGLSCAFTTIQRTSGSPSRAEAPSWIFVMTDGDANQGPRRTSTDLGDQVRDFLHQRPNTSIISLGFGTNYKPEILSSIGTFTHIRDLESMNSTLTLCLLEVLQAEATRCSFTLPRRIDDPQIIRPAPPTPVDLIGSSSFDVLSYNNEYMYGVAFPGLSLDGTSEASALVGQDVIFSYSDLTGERHELRTPVIRLSVVPIDVVIKYYQSVKGRMLNELAMTFRYHRNHVQPIIDDIRRRLSLWDVSETEIRKYGVDERSALEISNHIRTIRSDVETAISFFTEHAPSQDVLLSTLSIATTLQNQRNISTDSIGMTPIPPAIGRQLSTPLALASISMSRDVVNRYSSRP